MFDYYLGAFQQIFGCAMADKAPTPDPTAQANLSGRYGEPHTCDTKAELGAWFAGVAEYCAGMRPAEEGSTERV